MSGVFIMKPHAVHPEWDVRIAEILQNNTQVDRKANDGIVMDQALNSLVSKGFFLSRPSDSYYKTIAGFMNPEEISVAGGEPKWRYDGIPSLTDIADVVGNLLSFHTIPRVMTDSILVTPGKSGDFLDDTASKSADDMDSWCEEYVESMIK